MQKTTFAILIALFLSNCVFAESNRGEGLAPHQAGNAAERVMQPFWNPIPSCALYDYQFAGITQEQVSATKSAAAAQNPRAQFTLGMLYFFGDGVQQSQSEAYRWLRGAALQNEARAQAALSCLIALDQNLPESDWYRWRRAAANQGHMKSQYDMGALYFHGDQVRQDFASAMHWFRLAANQGLFLAMYAISSMYVSGQGVEPDFISAYMWALLGNDHNEYGFTQDEIFKNKLSHAEREDARRRAISCQRSGFQSC